jgi:addiction module HigA family antidote
MKHLLAPLHPGEVLLEEFMQPLEITQYRLAKETNVPARRINEIVKGQRSVTADTALRLAKFFGTSEMFWLNLQAHYDLDVRREKLGSGLASVRPFKQVKGAPPRVSRATKALVNSAKSGAARSGYRRKAK